MEYGVSSHSFCTYVYKFIIHFFYVGTIVVFSPRRRRRLCYVVKKSIQAFASILDYKDNMVTLT